MENNAIDRRGFLTGSLALAVPLALEIAAPPLASAAAEAGRKLKIICVGAHPDDPESGCAGTLARYAALGHAVTVLYLTRGERGIRDTGLEEAAKIRSAEAESACNLLGTKAAFFGQIDGDTRVTKEEVGKMSQWMATEKPDVVLTHWPVDTHMDHQVASLLAMRAYWSLREKPQIYYFEVNTGSQSRGFLPNTYVDISEVVGKKKAALLAHKSQDGESIWRQHHEAIAAWRGREIGVAAAEAFLRLSYGNRSDLQGLQL
jgi:LmbE family N-acetylglucosaminyl deacetylase